MKKINKLLLTCAIFATIGTLSANASSIVGEKKYNLREFETTSDLESLIRYNNKTYVSKFSYESDIYRNPLLFEISGDDKLKLDSGSIKYDILDEIYPDKKITTYHFNNNISGYNYGSESFTIGGKEISSGEGLVNGLPENGDIYYSNLVNGKVYATIDFLEEDNRTEMYLVAYNESDLNTVAKTFKMTELLNLVKKDGCTYSNSYLFTNGYLSGKDAFIVLDTTEYNSSTENYVYKEFIFNYDGSLFMELTSDDVIEDASYANYKGEPAFMYESCESEYTDCTLIVNTKSGKKEELLKSKENINAFDIEGFIVIEATDKDDNTKYVNNIYDENFNLVKSFDSTKELGINISKEITNVDEAIADSLSLGSHETIQEGNYLISTLDLNSENTDDEGYTNYMLSVENVKKATISGTLKDKDGNPLKDYIVELHSTLRTVTTDKNGYFKFDSVEEGEHTLTIKKSDGTVVATKTINVVPSAETKIDGDTLYFNSNDTGLNLSLKLDGDTLSIDKVEAGIKESNEVNPKTFDNILVTTISLLFIGLLSIITIKKNSRIKVIKIQ